MDNLPNRLSTVIDTTSNRDASIEVYQLGDESSLEFTIPFVDLAIGHVIRKELLDLPGVVFAGVKPPHPLEPKIVLRVKSVPVQGVEAEQTRPVRALWDAIQNARARIDDIGAAFALAQDAFDAEHNRTSGRAAAASVRAKGYDEPQYDYGGGEGGASGSGGAENAEGRDYDRGYGGEYGGEQGGGYGAYGSYGAYGDDRGADPATDYSSRQESGYSDARGPGGSGGPGGAGYSGAGEGFYDF